MLAIIISWFLTFFVISSFGFGFLKLFQKILKLKEWNSSIDVYYFIGFSVLLGITSLLSVWFPINKIVLIISFVISCLITAFNYTEFKASFSLKIGKGAFFAIVGFLLFILSALSHEINVGDTALYHTQAIKWIKQYAVVPGLGNIHGRFAFNSVFFVISGLFSFEIQDTVIYPLNALSLIVVLFKMIHLILIKFTQKDYSKIFAFLVLFLLLVNWLLPGLNSPSPDIILTIILVYVFLIYFSNSFQTIKLNLDSIILVNLLLFSCVVIKLSSVFCVLAILPLWAKERRTNIILSIITGIFFIIPFLLRNYYLSGYLIYPFPEIDLFSVDWKIPIEKVISEKQWIESWARIPGFPPSEVLNRSFSGWFIPWLKNLKDVIKIFLSINILSIIYLFIMAKKKEFHNIVFLLILYVNLIFWFINAPDPRFTFGFIFIGVVFSIFYLLKISNWNFLQRTVKYKKHLIIFLLFTLMIKFWYYPVHTIRNWQLWLIPTAIEKAEQEIIEGHFTYIHTLSDSKCYNSKLPCVPYVLENVVMRGNDIQDGFRVENSK